MKVQVTREDIRKGSAVSPRKCAIALAMKRLGIENPLIGPRDFTVITRTNQGIEILTRPLPKRARRFVSYFDCFHSARFLLWPFSFEIEVPQPQVP